MENGQDLIQAGGDVEISKLLLVNFSGEVLNITSLFTEMNIFEDIFSCSLSGVINMIDTMDVITNFPIIGEEQLIIEYKTAGYPEDMKITQVFKTYKLSDQIIAGPHKQTYNIHFTTPEAFMDLNMKLSKAYNGTSPIIIGNLLTKEIETEKDFQLEECSNNIKFVSPFWSPFKCINYAVKNAATSDSNKMGNYMFFETNLKYRFASLNTLFNDGVIASFHYSNDTDRNPVGDKSERDVMAEMSKIYDLRIDERFNQLNRMRNGTYSHTVWDHNLLFKSINKRTYHYDNDFAKSSHLGKYPVDSAKYNYSSETLMSSITSVPYTHNTIKSDVLGKTLTTRLPLMNQLDLFRMEITVHGRTDIEVGDLVNITIGGLERLTDDDKVSSSNYFDGKYIITSIMHRITAKKHLMVMNVAKESIDSDYKSWSEQQ